MANWREFPPLAVSRILEVALAEIVKQGYHAASVRTIATKAGMTVPALYYHHENKEAILVALMDHGMNIVTSHVEAALAEAGPDPVRRLSVTVEAIVLYMAHHPDIAFLDSERRSLSPNQFAHYLQRRDHIDLALAAAIEDGCASKVFATSRPREVRRAILSMCQGVAGWFQADGPKTAGETAQDYVAIALAAVECRAAGKAAKTAKTSSRAQAAGQGVRRGRAVRGEGTDGRAPGTGRSGPSPRTPD
jgi:AcrR family transcriptional regulator